MPETTSSRIVQIKDYLAGYSISVNSDWIDRRIKNEIVPKIERKLGFSLSSASDVTEFYDGNGSSVLLLRHKVVNRLNSYPIFDLWNLWARCR